MLSIYVRRVAGLICAILGLLILVAIVAGGTVNDAKMLGGAVAMLFVEGLLVAGWCLWIDPPDYE